MSIVGVSGMMSELVVVAIWPTVRDAVITGTASLKGVTVVVPVVGGELTGGELTGAPNTGGRGAAGGAAAGGVRIASVGAATEGCDPR